jgi:hypothetical protein
METLQDILDDTIKGLNKLLLKTHDPVRRETGKE